MMRFQLAILVCVTALAGCQDAGTDPAQRIIRIDYSSGYFADSLVVALDGKVLLQCRAYSAGLNVPVGCILAATEGLHTVSLYMPDIHLRTDIPVQVQHGTDTFIATHFDREHLYLTFSVCQL